MSILDISTSGWRAFWASALAPGSVGILLFIVVVAFLVGFVFDAQRTALRVAAKVIVAAIAWLLVSGFLGVLGVGLGGLTPWINWLLEQIQAPLYLPEG